ncbi:hypothetical protein KRE43_12760 [Elizabethkingia meningoseptica]|uniref:hypothetical protein n=1 Tax=Elizabethkingia meningoseptica TaxID=238 RepID=UPI0023B0588B|nr:hypothetical protein [Elizabethkingia meningoseptica]MDE5530451.1 hypothetical protein [Elizabethkingia meningoseptica]MDE5534008.1 hypothetical protein [Elizabethkingia meningoseptica]MDE5542716.1 hypothetical protein [Elizabethkingia meningoseptica]
MDLEEYEVIEKARELTNKFFSKNLLSMSRTDYLHVKFPHDKEVISCAAECAIICVDEMIQLLTILEKNTSFYEKVKRVLEKMK